MSWAEKYWNQMEGIEPFNGAGNNSEKNSRRK